MATIFRHRLTFCPVGPYARCARGCTVVITVRAGSSGRGRAPVSWMPGGPDVAIVGAGPAGLVLAHPLHREGIPFVLFERKTQADLCRLPKAGLIEYRTVRDGLRDLSDY